MKFRQILIKFSGEAFSQKGRPIDKNKVNLIVQEIKRLVSLKVKVAVVCGGGNVSRWRDTQKGDRVLVDLKGMKGTLVNVKALFKSLKSAKVPAQVYTSFSLKSEFPKFEYLKVKKDYQAGKVLIFAGGTGHPFFTTDTASILRALEIGAEVFIKATKVDGVYSGDPEKNSRAKKFKQLSYKKVIEDQLKVIDATAAALAWDNSLPIKVIKWESGNVVKTVQGQNLGSVIN